MPEVSPGLRLMALGTEALDVGVFVGAALAQGLDVIRNCGGADDALRFAVPAQRFSLQSALALFDGSTAT